MLKVTEDYNLEIGKDDFEKSLKNHRLVLTICFKINWLVEVRNDVNIPSQGYIISIKGNFMWNYVDAIKEVRYRRAHTKL